MSLCQFTNYSKCDTIDKTKFINFQLYEGIAINIGKLVKKELPSLLRFGVLLMTTCTALDQKRKVCREDEQRTSRDIRADYKNQNERQLQTLSTYKLNSCICTKVQNKQDKKHFAISMCSRPVRFGSGVCCCFSVVRLKFA